LPQPGPPAGRPALGIGRDRTAILHKAGLPAIWQGSCLTSQPSAKLFDIFAAASAAAILRIGRPAGSAPGFSSYAFHSSGAGATGDSFPSALRAASSSGGI
jgi:hypothetical protein